MKNRKIWRILCIVSGLLTVVAFLAQVAIAPTLAASHITKTFEYTADQPDALPEDVPDTVEVDGNEYSRVKKANAPETPEITITEETKQYTTQIEYEGLASKQAPETTEVEVNGKTVTLMLESADYTQMDKKYTATGDVEYENRFEKPEVPQTTEITYENESGELVTVEGTLKDLSQKDGEVHDTVLYATVSFPYGASVFLINGKFIPYNPDTPLWDGYQTDVIKEAKLNPNTTKVVGGEWITDAYAEDGETKRDIVWHLQTVGTTWIAHYEAEGVHTVYNATAKYSGNIADLGLADEDSNESEYELSAAVLYKLSKVSSNNPLVKLMSTNGVVVPAVAAVSLVAFLISLYGLFFMAKTKTSKFASKKASVSDGEKNRDEKV